MKSFFQTLAYLEKSILPASEYSNETKRILRKLICFTEEGTLAVSDSQKFLCSRFRTSNIKQLQREWEILHGKSTYKNGKPCKPKSEKSIRAQRSVISAKYEKHFSDINDIFITQDVVRMHDISERIDVLREGVCGFDELFLSEVVKFTMELGEEALGEYEISELMEELNLLSFLRSAGVSAKIKSVNPLHLSYIRRVLNEPLSYADGSVNVRKEAMLRVISNHGDALPGTLGIAPELYKVLDAFTYEVTAEPEIDMKRINKLVQLMGVLTPEGLYRWLSDKNYDSREMLMAMNRYMEVAYGKNISG